MPFSLHTRACLKDRALFEKLIVAHLLNELAFFLNPNFFVVSRISATGQQACIESNPVQSIPELFTYLTSLLKLSSHLLQCFPSVFMRHVFRRFCAFAKLRKVTISFVVSVRPSTWNISTPTRRIFIKFHI